MKTSYSGKNYMIAVPTVRNLSDSNTAYRSMLTKLICAFSGLLDEHDKILSFTKKILFHGWAALEAPSWGTLNYWSMIKG